MNVHDATEQAFKNGYEKGKADALKLIEGEWIKHTCSYECTVCEEEFFVEGNAEDYEPITDWNLHYCPNCGAKMKSAE